MKKLLMILLLISILFIAGCVTQQTTKQTSQEKEIAIVTEVTDADTITIQGGQRVRLLGIDAPEKGEFYYKESKEFLEQRILFQQVSLEKDKEDKDQYGRLLRWIWLNNTLINKEIVQQGMAIAQFFEKNEKHQKEIVEAEQQAIKDKIGLWQQLEEVNEMRTETQTSISQDSCVLLGCPQGTRFVASKNSDKYHECDCRWAKKIKQENLICFKTREEAEKKRTLSRC